MTTSGNLSKVIPCWSNLKTKLQNKDKRIIWLIGPNGSGKSTLCQLWMAVVANKRNQKLVYEAGKSVKTYSLPKIISGNVLKVQTVQPIVYDEFPDSIVVDVPTFALPPFNQSTKKMWNLIDSKVTFNYLLANSKKSCFVFVIDQKFTRAPMDGTKAALISFIDAFRDHPEQLFQCTAIIISKCPTGFKIDSAITKIEKLVQKIDDPNSNIINDWFQNIKARNAIFPFNKFTKEQDNEKQAKGLYEKVIELEPLDIDSQMIRSFDELSQELRDQVIKYLSGIQKVFGGLIILIIQIIQSLIKNQEAFQTAIDKLVTNNFGAVTQKLNKNQNTELPSQVVILSVCYGINKLTKSIQGNIFIQILQLFVKYGIVVKGDDIYNGLKERADFFNDFWKPGCDIAGWDVQKCLNYLQEQAGKIKNSPKMTQVIKDSFQQGKSEQFYENLIELVTYFVPEKDLQKSQLASVWLNSSLELAAIQPKTKSLKKFLDIQQKLKEWKKQELLGNVLTKIAELLMSLNRVPFALSLLSKCGNPQKGIQVMSTILNDKDVKKKFVIKDFMPYLDFLQQIGLYEKSYRTCYTLGSIFESLQERAYLRQYLSAPPSKPQLSILQSFIEKKTKGLDLNEMNILNDLALKLEKDSNKQ